MTLSEKYFLLPKTQRDAIDYAAEQELQNPLRHSRDKNGRHRFGAEPDINGLVHYQNLFSSTDKEIARAEEIYRNRQETPPKHPSLNAIHASARICQSEKPAILAQILSRPSDSQRKR